jgi:hypothetical protein
MKKLLKYKKMASPTQGRQGKKKTDFGDQSRPSR